MSRPWRKNWPRVARNGRRSYQVGFYDHDRVERTKTFPSASLGREWMAEYSAAERRGKHSLRRFLLDLDAAEASASEERTLGEVMQLYFAHDADPSLQAGLAPATFARYSATANCHILGRPIHDRRGRDLGRAPYAVALSRTPATHFNGPDAARRWRSEMLAAGRTQTCCREAWNVLSAALSWAAASHLVAEINTNGCLLAGEQSSRRRRSARSGGTGRAAQGRRRSSRVAAWALSPQAVEAIGAQLLARTRRRDPILAQRDAIVVSLQYGLAARNQEVWGLRWSSLSQTFAQIVEVVSWGRLDEFGKTAYSTERRTAMPSLLWTDLCAWRAALRAWGHPARDVDFVIPGDLGGSRWGVLDPDSGACHLSLTQCRSWGGKFFAPAVTKAAERPQLKGIAGATPYALRRGGISARLRAEDAQTVASECGTSLQMLDRHYAFAIDDLRRFGPKPFDEVWQAARHGRRDDD